MHWNIFEWNMIIFSVLNSKSYNFLKHWWKSVHKMVKNRTNPFNYFAFNIIIYYWKKAPFILMYINKLFRMSITTSNSSPSVLTLYESNGKQIQHAHDVGRGSLFTECTNSISTIEHYCFKFKSICLVIVRE